MSSAARRMQKEFGDFQTPPSLARRVVEFVSEMHPDVQAVVEPTCGVGAFLVAAQNHFGPRANYFGFDINPEYVRQADQALRREASGQVSLQAADFYSVDWSELFSRIDGKILVLGNPPWVTSSEMGALAGTNLPAKKSPSGLKGLDAKTGKSNFDITEWMIECLVRALGRRSAVIALLCKSSSARKVLSRFWNEGGVDAKCSVHRIDAETEFGVAVEACLLVIQLGSRSEDRSAVDYGSLGHSDPLRRFGIRNHLLVSDVERYDRCQELDGLEHRRWRSGVKHDASPVMELTRSGSSYINSLGEVVDIEDDYVFPLLKSSDLYNGRVVASKFVIITQRAVGEATSGIERAAPRTWRYLCQHGVRLDGRKSSIYKGRPRFSVFGVGDYTFAPAKVAVSGLHKKLVFSAIDSQLGKPVVFDDTCYFMPCTSYSEALFFCELLNSPIAKEFLYSLIFIDSKRPVTIEVLRRLDLKKLALLLEREVVANGFLEGRVMIENQPRLELASV